MYVEYTVAFSDEQFRFGVAGVGVVLVVGLTAVRFCGSVSLPPKPEAPAPHAHAVAPADDVNASPTVYKDYLAKDASAGAVRTPTYEEMTHKLTFHLDDLRHVLEVGAPAIDAAGLKLSAQLSGEVILLDIQNTTSTDLGYVVATSLTPSVVGCNSARPLPFDAMVIAPGQHEVRVECVWRAGTAIAVTRVETVELLPLQSWYLEQVPPMQVGVEERVARGHRAPKMRDRCISLGSQMVRNGIENGEIGWRDLVDFYARHRCQTYTFPSEYRVFTGTNQLKLPVMPKGM